MFRKSVLVLVVALAAASSSGRARAEGYSVFGNSNIHFYDFSAAPSWYRSAISWEVYTTLDSCWSNVVDRIVRDWEYNITWEAYMIVWSDARPALGCLCPPTFSGAAQVVLLTYPVGNSVWIWYGGQWYGPFSG